MFAGRNASGAFALSLVMFFVNGFSSVQTQTPGSLCFARGTVSSDRLLYLRHLPLCTRLVSFEITHILTFGRKLRGSVLRILLC